MCLQTALTTKGESKNVDKLQRKYLPGVEEGRWGQAQYKDVRFRVII